MEPTAFPGWVGCGGTRSLEGMGNVGFGQFFGFKGEIYCESLMYGTVF